MNIVYFTTKCYPSTIADDIYAHNLAEAFSECDNHFKFYTASYKAVREKWIVQFYPFKKLRKVAAIIFLFFLFIKNKNVIIFTNDINLIGTLSFYKKFFNFRLVFDWHMLFSPTKTIEALNTSDINITTSKKLKLSLGNIKESDIEVVYGGVDIEKFKNNKEILRLKMGFTNENKYIVYAGGFKTMGMEKGLKTVIDSLEYLGKEYNVVLVGGKNEEIEEYAKYARDRVVFERVVLVGKVNQSDISEYMQAGDILTIPYPDSIHFSEFGFPMKTFEYMASGNPIIYSDLEIIKEVLLDSGTSFEPGNPKDFAEKVMYISGRHDETTTRTQTALQKVKNLTWTSKAQKIYDIIRKRYE